MFFTQMKNSVKLTKRFAHGIRKGMSMQRLSSLEPSPPDSPSALHVRVRLEVLQAILTGLQSVFEHLTQDRKTLFAVSKGTPAQVLLSAQETTRALA